MKAKKISGVPEQKKGGFHDTESRKTFADKAVGEKQFEVLKERLFSVNQWKSYCNKDFADFKLFDAYGDEVNRFCEIGDFIRIDIPGPGELEAKGYDWVQVISIFSDDDEVIITCKPTMKPGKRKSFKIAHFYSSRASSTFRIVKKNDFIEAGIYGRNETPNFNASFLDMLRNIIISIGGMMGFAKIQWKCLTDGLLDF
ncbi:hypothetical protein ABEG63_17900 [Chryseobacterium sp. C39-AII1]|uniref:hypothetical protein n=1 Tax=Chryseobacterium sp. C39-AII1 TaxID=3080332 RepID=UPI00320A03DC